VVVVGGAGVDIQAMTPFTVRGGGGAVALVQAASISVMATVARAPSLRTMSIYSTSAWHLVRRAEDKFCPRLDARRRKRIVTL
jgi:hypothetical protein